MGGRPSTLDPQPVKLALKLYEEREQTVQVICKLMGISNTTFHNYVHRSPAKKKSGC